MNESRQDAFGYAVRVGDAIAYFKGGRYDALCIGRVKKLTPSGVRVTIMRSTRSEYEGDEVFVRRDRLLSKHALPMEEVFNQ